MNCETVMGQNYFDALSYLFSPSQCCLLGFKILMSNG